MSRITAPGNSGPHVQPPRILWRVAAVLFAVTATVSTACTDGRDGPSMERSVSAAEERLDFVWDEAIEVPASQRPPVDVAREWMYGYYLWHTGLRSMPAEITDNSASEGVYPRGATPPPTTGTVRVTLVDLKTGEAEVMVVGVCSDSSEHTFGGGILGRWLTLQRTDAGQWLLVDRPARDEELHQVCERLWA